MALAVFLLVGKALGLHPRPLVVSLAWKGLFEPVEKLRGRIRLVVVLALWEHGQLVEVFGEPGGTFGDMDKAVLDHRGLRVQTHGFVEGRLIPGGGIAALAD